MKKNIIALSIVISNLVFSQIYTGNVGIDTSTPNSTLTVNGSLQAQYNEITTTYTLTDKDYYISYIGTSNVIFTLPTVESGDLSFSGRIYRIKNISNYALTIQASDGNYIRNTSTNGIGSVIVPAGYYIEIVNNKISSTTPSAPTWDLSFLGSPKIASNSTDATRFLGGTVYARYGTVTGGTLNSNNVINGNYSVGTNNPSVAPIVGGINSILGEGYKVSNPSNGIFDIKFTKAFTQIYGISVNITDSFSSNGATANQLNPVPSDAGSTLNTKENTQVSFISNTIIRIKTGDLAGNLVNRPFSFQVTGQ